MRMAWSPTKSYRVSKSRRRHEVDSVRVSKVEAKETHVRVHLGVQEQPAPKSTPRPHMESVMDDLYIDGKIISRSFQWHQFEAQILSESMGIVETI